jgi:hypothetical protein
MKKILLTCMIVAGILHSNISFSQKTEKEVAEAVENLRLQMINPDSLKLAALVSDKLSYGHSGGHIEDKAAFIQTLVSGKSDFVTIDLSEQQITVVDKMAIVRHILNATNNDGGKPGTVKLSILSVWYKEKGGWKLIARQAVKLQ